MKRCPYCAEKIQDEAVKCRFCGEWLSESPEPSMAKEPPTPDAGQSNKKEQIPADDKEEQTTEEQSPNLDDNKVRAFKAKFDSMTIAELLRIRDSYVPQDYTPEARHVLNEIFTGKKDELDLEQAALAGDKESSSADGKVPADDRERLTAEDEIANLDDNIVRAFRVKFDSMTIGELLKIRDSYAPQDYTPEARYALNEAFFRKKDDLNVEKAVFAGEEKLKKEKRSLPTLILFYIYSILAITSIVAVITIYILASTGISNGLDSVISQPILIFFLLPLTGFWFLIALGLLRLGKKAYTINFILLAIGLIANILRVLLGEGTIQLRIASSLPYLVWCGGWLVYFSTKKRYFNR